MVVHRSARNGFLSSLSVPVTGSARDDTQVPRGPLGAEVRLRREELAERDGVEGALRHLEGRHHLVAGASVGHGVHGDAPHRFVALKDPFHGGGGEVLAVDAEPVTGATGEEEDPIRIAVHEVTGPVPPVSHAVGVGLGVVVVALEPVAEVASHQLADRLAGVQQPTVVPEAGSRTLDAGLGVDDGEVVAVVGHPHGAAHPRPPAS